MSSSQLDYKVVSHNNWWHTYSIKILFLVYISTHMTSIGWMNCKNNILIIGNKSIKPLRKRSILVQDLKCNFKGPFSLATKQPG